MGHDPYAVLGVPRSVTLAQAEDAYHRSMRREHPDVHHGAGPERVAEAEQRTRELTGAISAIRAERAVRADVGSRRVDGHDLEASDDAGRTDGSVVPDEPVSTARCPWCGEPFARADILKHHVLDEHGLRLDRRQRASLFGGRLHRAGRAAAHLPLWGVIPINVAVATVIGVLAAAPTNESLGWWAAAIAMTPSLAALIDRAFDLTR